MMSDYSFFVTWGFTEETDSTQTNSTNYFEMVDMINTR